MLAEITGLPAGVSLGADRTRLRRLLGDHDAFRRVGSALLSDQFATAGLMLNYDSADRVTSIDAVQPLDLRLRGVELLDRPYGAVVEELTACGFTIEDDDVGGLVVGSGVYIYNGASDERDEPTEVVTLYPVDWHPERNAHGVWEGVGDVGPLAAHRVVARVGTDRISLDEDRQHLRERLGRCYHSVPEDGWHAAQDRYVEHGLTLGFDPADRLVTIVIDGPAEAQYDDIPLLRRPSQEVAADLTAAGVLLVEREAEYWAPELNIAIWTARSDRTLPVSAVVIGRLPYKT
ncbi:hypothetical protein [Micromonospora coerulea]|uniref:hypothetical protein n=1 Tax=Micromonospora coerulea TaxID=47856 RepID=UPI001904B70A|nr:hypothetical protein [Micromonospora veneta]